ncbi:MAG TPA: lysophospholipase [Anaerolineales bacterium]
MIAFESDWQSADGVNIHGLGWEPNQKPRAVVCLVHGLGEHIGRYEHVAKALTWPGYAIFGFDQRGHGRSGGPRGHTPSYETLMQDIDDLLARARQRYLRLPLFLYGHSMGGNEVINYGLRRKPDLAGVIATSPYLRLAFPLPPARERLARIADRIAPGLTQRSGLETAALSHDPRVIDAYIHDPLVHDKITPRLFTGLRDSGEWAIAHAREFPLPLLLMHGSADRLTSPDASREFAHAGGSHITLQIWDGCYHELHNEADQEEVFKLMVIWMDARLAL